MKSNQEGELAITIPIREGLDQGRPGVWEEAFQAGPVQILVKIGIELVAPEPPHPRAA
jgi:hypothetical protein